MSAPMDVVKKNIDAWNEHDIESRLSTLHFPQYRTTGTGNLVEESEEIIGEKWKKALEFAEKYEKWDHSEIDEVEIIHSSENKVHLVASFGRYRADGSKYASLKSFWVLSKFNCVWKRTLASNMPMEYYLPEDEISIIRQRRQETLNSARARARMMKELERHFESKVEIPLIRYGKRQRIETLINEESLLLAKYLRNEKADWTPRIAMAS